MIQQTKELIRVNDPLDLEKVIPEPISKESIFYYYPDNKIISVSKNGLFFNTKTKKLITVNTNKKGIKNITFASDNGKICNYRAHRVLARTFIGRPSRHKNTEFNELEVNHIDGNRSNNNLCNLEWVTSKENVSHAHASGFHPLDIEVLAKCVKTNNIIKFVSTKACADYFNVNRITMWKHLTKGKIDKHHKEWHVFKFNDGTPWKEINPKNLVRLGSEIYKYFFYVTDKLTKKIIIFDNYYDTAKFLGISISRLFRRLAKEGLYENERFKCSKKNMH